MNREEIIGMLNVVSDAAINAKEELCRLDGFVGDGDHGFTVERGFKAVKEMLTEVDLSSPKAVIEATGDELADTMGGAIGLIIGGLFTGGAEAMDDKEDFDTEDMYILLSAGLEEIKLIGGAKEGDATLIDALSPACDAYKAAMDENKKLAECIEIAADAADAGAQNTANMVAKKGRAKFLQEESKGHVDAGSVTMATIIRAMSDYINK